MKLRIFLLLSVPFIILSSLSLSAQDQVVMPQNIIGDAADSVTGGQPSVMVRRVQDVEYKSKERNLIFTDPAKDFLYYNLSYYRGLSYSIAVGGGLQFAPGIVSDSASSNGFGLQLGAKFFLANKGLKGFHLDPALYIYSVTHQGNKQIPFSLVGDVAYQWTFFNGFLDFKIGVEQYLVPLRGGDAPDPDALFDDGLFMVGFEDQSTALHFTIQYGITW